MSEIFNFNLTFLSLWEDFDVLTISYVTVSRVDTLDSSGSPVWRLDPVSVFSRVYVTSNPSARTAMEASRQSVSEASTLRRKQVRRVAWHSLNRNFACNLHSLAQRWEFSGSSATFSEFFCSQCDRRAPPTTTMNCWPKLLFTYPHDISYRGIFKSGKGIHSKLSLLKSTKNVRLE